MGTRADFWIGIGSTAEWIGSISFDGNPDGVPSPLFDAKTEAQFRRLAARVLDGCEKERAPFTRPTEGWPWPWEDSRTTDYAYAWVPFDAEAVSVARDAAIESVAAHEGDKGGPKIALATSILVAAGLERDPEVVDKGGWFWDLVAGRIATSPPGRVLISGFGHEWHSLGFIERFRLLPDEEQEIDYMGLRELRDDEVVDMRARKADTSTILAKSGMIILQGPR